MEMYKLTIGILSESESGANKILDEVYKNENDVNKTRGVDWCECNNILWVIIPRNHKYIYFDQILMDSNCYQKISDIDYGLISDLLKNSCVPVEHQLLTYPPRRVDYV